MTITTTNGTRPPVTVGANVRVRMRVAENPPPAPDPGVPAQESAPGARELAHEPAKLYAHRPANFRNFASPHVDGVRGAVAGSWPLTERPPDLMSTVRATFPAKGEASNPAVWVGMTFAGICRTVGTAFGQLWLFAYGTRIRSAVSTAVIALLLTAPLAGGLNHPLIASKGGTP